jgi:hypothetical protein
MDSGSPQRGQDEPWHYVYSATADWGEYDLGRKWRPPLTAQQVEEQRAEMEARRRHQAEQDEVGRLLNAIIGEEEPVETATTSNEDELLHATMSQAHNQLLDQLRVKQSILYDVLSFADNKRRTSYGP